MSDIAVGFRYRVNIEGVYHHAESGFSEVSGISAEIETETCYSGGDNDSSYSLPTRIKHGDLVLKRGFINMRSEFGAWVLKTMSGNLTEILTHNIEVDLIDEEQNTVMQWQFENAYPVKWEISNFNAMENKVVLESISIRYTNFRFILV